MRFMLAVFTFCMLAGCLEFGKDYGLDASTFDAKAMKRVEGLTGLNLPPGSKGLHMYCWESGIDPAMIAKVEIPAEAVPKLAGQIETLQSSDYSIASPPKDHAWWNPSAMKIRIQRSVFESGRGLRIILGEENGRWMLLVWWHTT